MSDDLVERLRDSTEKMANHAVVGMGLWDLHLNACLEAADRIEQLEATLQEILEWQLTIRVCAPELDMVLLALDSARTALGEKKDD